MYCVSGCVPVFYTVVTAPSIYPVPNQDWPAFQAVVQSGLVGNANLAPGTTKRLLFAGKIPFPAGLQKDANMS